MKKKVIMIVILIFIIAGAAGYYFYQSQRNVSVGINENIVDENQKKGSMNLNSEKILVVYFSHGGNTQKLAKEISDQVGGDFRRIETVVAYPNDDELYDYAKQQQDNDERPEINDLNIDITQYDTVFVGYPIWWYTYPQPILTFFDNYDLSHKTIIPFCTHGGSGLSGTQEDMENYLSGIDVTVLDGLAVSRTDIEKSQKETVTNWLQKLDLK